MPLIRFAVGSGPRSVAVAPDGRHVYVTLVNENTVSVIDTTLNAVVTTIPVGSGPVDVAVAPDGRHVYVTVINENTVSVIDTSLNAVVTTIPVPDPFHLAVAPDGRHVYVSHGQLNRVSVIDTTLNAVVTTIQAGARPATTTTLAVAPDGRHVYVSLASQTVDANAVLVIDTTTNAVVTTIPVGGIGPIIAVAPDGRYLYVANAPDESARVSVIDTTLNAVVTTIPVASTVSSVAVAPDGGRVYVTLFNERTVSVINTAANAVVTTIPVGSDPADVAVSAENIYVINEGSDSLSVLSVSDVPVSLLVLMEFGYDAGGWRVERHPRFLADLTGDGRADIVGFANEGVFVALNNGNGTFQQPRLALSEFGYDAGGWRVERHPRFLADLTGDGRADIVGFANEGVIVALNNGNGTFQPRGLVLSEFGYDAGGWRVERHPRFLADLTGDGRADIVGFANEGVIVALNNGNGTFQQPRLVLSEFGYDAGGWRVERHPRFLADLTGDGRADIVGFANEGVYCRPQQRQRNFPTTPVGPKRVWI